MKPCKAESGEEHPCATCVATGEGQPLKATHMCTDCPGGKYLCEEDTDRHRKKLKHTIIPLDNRAVSARSPHACKEHSLPLDMFCEDCVLPLCIRCAFLHASSSDTKHHSVKGLAEMTGLAASVQGWLARAREASAALGTSSGDVSAAMV